MNIEIYIWFGVSLLGVLALFKIGKGVKNMAISLDNLNLAVVDLTAAVDAAVLVIGTPGVPEADVQLAADAINVQKDRLNAALVPVPPPVP